MGFFKRLFGLDDPQHPPQEPEQESVPTAKTLEEQLNGASRLRSGRTKPPSALGFGQTEDSDSEFPVGVITFYHVNQEKKNLQQILGDITRELRDRAENVEPLKSNQLLFTFPHGSTLQITVEVAPEIIQAQIPGMMHFFSKARWGELPESLKTQIIKQISYFDTIIGAVLTLHKGSMDEYEKDIAAFASNLELFALYPTMSLYHPSDRLMISMSGHSEYAQEEYVLLRPPATPKPEEPAEDRADAQQLEDDPAPEPEKPGEKLPEETEEVEKSTEPLSKEPTDEEDLPEENAEPAKEEELETETPDVSAVLQMKEKLVADGEEDKEDDAEEQAEEDTQEKTEKETGQADESQEPPEAEDDTSVEEPEEEPAKEEGPPAVDIPADFKTFPDEQLSDVERRRRIFLHLEQAGIPYVNYLPSPALDGNTSRREKITVAQRLMGLFSVCQVARLYALDMPLSQPENEARRILQRMEEKYHVSRFWTPREREYLSDPGGSQEETAHFVSQLEAVAQLAWALSLVRLKPLNQVTKIDELLVLFQGHDYDGLVRRARLRPKAELMELYELVYRYHWAAQDAYMQGKEFAPAHLGVTYHRHYALVWLLGVYGRAEWDDVIPHV